MVGGGGRVEVVRRDKLIVDRLVVHLVVRLIPVVVVHLLLLGLANAWFLTFLALSIFLEDRVVSEAEVKSA